MFGFSRNPERHQKIGRAVRIVVGLILIASAALKLDDLLYGEATALLWLPSPRWVFAAIEVEALVGLWLLSGWQARWAWVVALILFLILAVVSLTLALQGQSTCGCFGRALDYLSPWMMFGIDVVILAGLGFVCPQMTTAVPISWMKDVCHVGLGVALLLGIVLAAVFILSDNPIRLVANLRNELLIVEPAITELGTAAGGQVRSFTVTLANHSEHDVRILGGTTSCSCITTNDLPVYIPSGHSAVIRVQVKFVGRVGRFLRYFQFYTDQGIGFATARFAGVVVDGSTTGVP